MAQPRRRTAARRGGGDVVVEAAWMYYNDGLNQHAIATRLGVSRASVVNYLQEARERGLIVTRLSLEGFFGHQLSIALRERFGLAAAVVVPAGHANDDEARARVAAAAADWLPDLLEPGDALGVAWGSMIHEVAEAIEPRPKQNLRVVQMVGSMETPSGLNAETCTALLAERLGGQAVNLYAPAILTCADLAARLREEPIIKAQLEALAHCNKAVFAAGTCHPSSHIVMSGIVSLDDLCRCVDAGARGALCGRFIDARGQPVAGPLAERVIGASLDRLLGLDMGLLVSSGEGKVEATAAVLRGGYASHFVTDERTAAGLLALA